MNTSFLRRLSILIAAVPMAVAWVTVVAAQQATGQALSAAAGNSEQEEAKARAYFTDTVLLNQQGEQVRFYTDVLKDNVVLINTIFTNCEDACPMMTHKLTAVLDRLTGDLFGKQVHFVSISTDPERDSPKALADFARKQKADHPGWVFLTGNKQSIQTVLGRFGQYSEDPESHSVLLIAGNARTRHWIKIKPSEPPMSIALKLEDLAAEK